MVILSVVSTLRCIRVGQFIPDFSSPPQQAVIAWRRVAYIAGINPKSLKVMSKNTALKEHDSHELDSNSTMERGDCELAEVEDFWQPRMRVWSDRKISENKVVRMYGMVTGSLTRLIVPADSPNSPAIPTLRVRVRWDGLESDVLLHPDEVVPYTELTTAEPKTFVQEASQTIVQETLVATVDVLAQVLTGAEARQYADFDGLGTIKDASPISARITPMPGSASPSSRKVFDYASLDAGTSQFVQQQTGEIRVLMKRTAQGIIEVGQKLIEVKEKLGHGRFGEWLEAEFAWSDFTARQ